MRRRVAGAAVAVTALAAGAIAGPGAGATSIAVAPVVAQQTLIGRSAQDRPIAVTRIAYAR